MAIDVDTIVSDEDVTTRAGARAVYLQPDTWTDLKPARQHALDRVLELLRNRDPKILETDLADPTELKQVLIDGALSHLYDLGMNSGDMKALYGKLFKVYEQRFVDGVMDLQPTLTTGDTVFLGAMQLHRR